MKSSPNSLTRHTWLAVAPAMIIPFVASLFYFVIFPGGAPARVIYAGVKVFLVVWPLAALFLIYKEKPPRIEHAGRHLRAIPLGILTGLLIALLAGLLMRTPLRHVVFEAAGNIRVKCEALGVLKHYWLFAVFLSVIHSFIEEYYWRWFVYGRLRAVLQMKVAVVLAAVGFASHHIVIVSQFFSMPWFILFGTAIGLGGALWCWMFERQQSLVGAWISHMIVDFAVMAIGYRAMMTGG